MLISALRNLSGCLWSRQPVGEPDHEALIELEGANPEITERYNRAAKMTVLTITIITGAVGAPMRFWGLLKNSEIIPMGVAAASATLLGSIEGTVTPASERICAIFQRMFDREVWGNAAIATLAGYMAFYLTDGSTSQTATLKNSAVAAFVISPLARLLFDTFRLYFEPVQQAQ